MEKRKGIKIKVPLWDNQLVHNLLVAFVVLKLCGVIDWGWVWILSPKWIQILLTCVFEVFTQWKSLNSKYKL